MNPRYRCPYCSTEWDSGGRLLNHMFGPHRQLLKERLGVLGGLSRPDKPFRDLEDAEKEIAP